MGKYASQDPAGVSVAWGDITGKPNTISGYGITDAAPKNNPVFTGTVQGVTKAMVGLGNVDNESKATMFTNPAFTGYASVTANDPYLALITNSAGTLVSPRNRKLLWRNYAGEEAGSVNLLDYNQDVLGTTMVFSVRNNAGAIIEAMRIIQNGNTAIGMTPGSEKFEVNGSIKGASLKTANFTFEESGTDLLIKYGVTVITSISSAGYIKAKNELEPFADI